MLKTLGGVCRDARQGAGRSQYEIALVAGVSEATISRFEAASQVQRLERIVAAYERECGLPPGALWRKAVERAFGT